MQSPPTVMGLIADELLKWLLMNGILALAITRLGSTVQTRYFQVNSAAHQRCPAADASFCTRPFFGLPSGWRSSVLWVFCGTSWASGVSVVSPWV